MMNNECNVIVRGSIINELSIHCWSIILINYNYPYLFLAIFIQGFCTCTVALYTTIQSYPVLMLGPSAD